MADHNPQHGRRPHVHRGRRGPDRRGPERRTLPRERPGETERETTRDGGVDVEQIMREIRSRIAQRHGIELSTSQIQELAARRLEAILEPRNVNPQLLEQLRRSAAASDVPASPPLETYEFEESTLFDTHRGIVRFFRRLLNPILKLFFNPTPLIQALKTQARINKELSARELDREQRQSEWNALQFELVQRMVLEASRISLEMQALTSRIESLSAKVDFNERRVRSVESVPSGAPSRPVPRPPEVPAQHATVASTAETPTTEAPASPDGATDGTRRRRRRRRGRRSGGGVNDVAAPAGLALTPEDDLEGSDAGESEDDETIAADTGGEVRPVIPAAAPAISEVQSAAPPQEPATTAGVGEQQPQPPALAIPSPPRDEPVPEAPTDHADPGPVDR